MNHTHYRYITIVGFMQLLLVLPGCKFMDWGNATFRQAEKVSDKYCKSMAPFLRSAAVYDQFVSIADFSALFLTDDARMLYADYFFHRNFKTPDEQALSRERLLKENDYYITFYVVGYQPPALYPSGKALFSGEYQVQGPLLGSVDANWKLSMVVDGKEYAPSDIRSIRLPVEYQHFFGVHWSQFKLAYKVRFDAQDEHGNDVLSPGAHNVTLKFNSVVYDVLLEWKNIEYHQ